MTHLEKLSFLLLINKEMDRIDKHLTNTYYPKDGMTPEELKFFVDFHTETKRHLLKKADEIMKRR